MWPAIIGAAAAIGGSLLSNRGKRQEARDYNDTSYRIAQEQNLYNRQMAEWAMANQDRLSWEHWNAMNAYNHPKQQMARLREAGLNPLLVYGSGGVSGNSSSMAPVPNVYTPQAASRDHVPVPTFSEGLANAIFAYQDFRQRDLQSQLTSAQTEYTLARAAQVRQSVEDGILARQSPARSAAAVNGNDFLKKVRNFGLAAGSVFGSGLAAKKLFGSARGGVSSGSAGATTRVIRNSSSGIFGRVGKWATKALAKGAFYWNLLKPRPLGHPSDPTL